MAEARLGGRLLPDSHVCAFIEDGEEPATLFAPFLRDGLEQGERVVAIAGPSALHKHRRELQALNTDTAQCEAAGQLQLLPWTEVQAATPTGFDPFGTLSTVSSIMAAGTGATPPASRLLAEMDWVVSITGGGDAVARYEEGLDRLARERGHVVLCVFDLSRLSGQLLMQLLASHPLAWTRGQLVPSPFYTSPS
jgi:hypothetical protein